MNELIKNNAEVINMKLLIDNGLADKKGLNEKYYTVYVNYKALLDRYLVKMLELDVYDKSIDDSGYKFKPVDPLMMDYYQYMSAMNLKYLYLRNNLYIEKLSKEQVAKLLILTPDDLKNPSEEVMKIIEDTYQNVIDKSPDNDGSYMTRYGPDGDRFWFPSDALIIGVRYDMFADNGLDDNAWEENNTNQLMFINTLTNEIANKGKEVLNLYVNVVMYTDYTIKETVNIKR